MVAIDIILPRDDVRRWQEILVERLSRAGHDTAVRLEEPGGKAPWALDRILAFEALLRRGGADSLSARVATMPSREASRPADMTIDLTGNDRATASPTLRVTFDGSPCVSAALRTLAKGGLPELGIVLDGNPIDEASPMICDRSIVSRGLDDVLARAITLTVSTACRFADGTGLPPGAVKTVTGVPHAAISSSEILGPYATTRLPQIARRTLRKFRRRPTHWHVGYRFADGPGVAETGTLAGAPWSLLPDDGTRYYADPFPVARDGRHYLFVEEYINATGKGVISAAVFGPDGVCGTPAPVLEEPHHLSYPQVFERDGETWMIPESSAGGEVSLYRAERFPDRWVLDRRLIEGRDISDATLLDTGNRLWLFGTERDGHGSPSDTLVVFSAETLRGPWRPHRRNPILIDRAAARPGGAFVKAGGRIFLPIQNGTYGYGSGLGLSEVVVLDDDRVQLTRPKPIEAARADWPYPGIHTLNRCGRLETIDGSVISGR
ncbi:MAG: hypothetical protein KDJ88_17310 [Bauldia sp.]|nr:hypothetical protein [Bauldia sp.]